MRSRRSNSRNRPESFDGPPLLLHDPSGESPARPLNLIRDKAQGSKAAVNRTKNPYPDMAARLEAVAAITARHSGRLGALLPILHDVQAELGHVPPEAVAVIAGGLNLSRAEVHGVLSFYHDFRAEPADRPVVKLCRAEACQARGVSRIAQQIEADGRVAVETVYCLGLCASGPAAMIGSRVFARLDEAAARRLVEEACA